MQSRRELFSKILGAKPAPKFIDPPFFSGEFDCAGCDASCVSACEKELLSFENERVVFKVKKLGCDFCEECAKACQSSGHVTRFATTALMLVNLKQLSFLVFFAL